MRRWRIAAAALGATLLATGATVPAHAQLQVFEGQGQLVLTFTAAGQGLPLNEVIINCRTFNVTGTGVIEFAIGTAVYAGPVTVTGTWSACGDANVNQGNFDILITGDPLLGDFGCGGGPLGTQMQGVILGLGPVTVGGVAGTCHVGSATTVLFPAAMLGGVRTPSAVDLATQTVTGYTETVPFTASPV